MRRYFTLIATFMFAICAYAAPKTYELNSPDGKLNVSVKAGEELAYSLVYDGDILLENSPVAPSSEAAPVSE